MEIRLAMTGMSLPTREYFGKENSFKMMMFFKCFIGSAGLVQKYMVKYASKF